MTIVFSLIIHTVYCFFVGTGFRGLDPPKNLENCTQRKLSHPQYDLEIVKFGSRVIYLKGILCAAIPEKATH